MDITDDSPVQGAVPSHQSFRQWLSGDQHASKSTKATELIDPHGDVVLEVPDPTSDSTNSFLVSTKILGLASPVFERLFSPCFKEGQDILLSNSPHIQLDEDDCSAMEQMLKTLHFQGDLSKTATAKQLATLAIHCDKYHCVKALGPWVSHWFGKVAKVDDRFEELGYLLLAAYMFDDSEQFAEISKRALKELGPECSSTWEALDSFDILPAIVPDAISLRLGRVSAELQVELQTGETLLRQFQRCYAVEALFCTDCGRTLPTNAKKCHPCSNTDLLQKYCTCETRISDYFASLRKNELWPTEKPFKSCSISDLVYRFACIKNDLKHSCAAGSTCPLERIIDHLSTQVYTIQAKIKGFCLRCVKSEEWDESQKCTHS